MTEELRDRHIDFRVNGMPNSKGKELVDRIIDMELSMLVQLHDGNGGDYFRNRSHADNGMPRHWNSCLNILEAEPARPNDRVFPDDSRCQPGNVIPLHLEVKVLRETL
jgi:hypothetical protein